MKLLESPLIVALRDPAQMARFSDTDWDLGVRQARATGLLGRLGVLAEGAGVDVPLCVRPHFSALRSIVARQQNAVRWEVRQIAQALEGLDVRVVLLKGAAYVMADAPSASGRMFADIDILVPRERLGDVEHALFVSGWMIEGVSRYDNMYYRRWMHELPPMVHLRRRTSLDVHHNILPQTARIQSRPDLILAAAVPVPQFTHVFVPAPQDRLLHSATHLFHEGEWSGGGLRDLSDLDLLMRAYAADDPDGSRLAARALELNLQKPLLYAAKYLDVVFRTPLAGELRHHLARAGLRGSAWMDRLFMTAFAGAHASTSSRSAGAVRAMLYVRGHWLRMPWHRLIPHLVYKAFADKSPQ